MIVDESQSDHWLAMVPAWRLAFLVSGLAGVIWCLAFYPWFRDEPAAKRSVNKRELQHIESGRGLADSSHVADATAKGAAEARDEDLDGPVGYDSAAQRKREFAADMGVQAHALRMAAEGAVAAYEQIVGEVWKPFDRPVDNPGQSLDRKAAAAQMSAFD